MMIDRIKTFIFSIPKQTVLKLLSLFFSLVSCGVFALVIWSLPYNILLIAIYSLFLLAMTITVLIINKVAIFSLVGAFLLFLFIFNFGIPLTTVFSISLTKANMNSSYLYWLSFAYSPYVSLENMKSSYLFSSFFILLIVCGVVIGNMIKPLKKQNIKLFNGVHNFYNSNTKKQYQLFLLGLIIISWPPFFINLFYKLRLYFDGGYLATYNNSLPGFIVTLADLFYVSILFALILLSIGEKQKKNESVLFHALFYFTLVVCIIEMIKGNRYQQTIYLFTFSIIYLKRISRNYTKKAKIILGLFVFLLFACGVTFLSYVSSARTSGTISFKGLISFLVDNGFGSIIAKSLIEYGSTIKSTQLAIQFFPSYHNYLFGFTYLASLASIYPNVFNLYGSFTKYYTFTSFFPKHTTSAIGGNMIGESFCNFGFFFSMVFALLVGFFVIKSFIALKQNEKNRNPFLLSLFYLLFISLFSWVRGYACSYVFVIFVFLSIFSIMKIVMNKRTITKKTNPNFWSLDV